MFDEQVSDLVGLLTNLSRTGGLHLVHSGLLKRGTRQREIQYNTRGFNVKTVYYNVPLQCLIIAYIYIYLLSYDAQIILSNSASVL